MKTLRGGIHFGECAAIPDLNLCRSDVDASAVDPGKLKRKIDFRLVPSLDLLYLMNSLDPGSIRVRSVSTSYQPLRLGRSSRTACRRTYASRISSTSRSFRGSVVLPLPSSTGLSVLIHSNKVSSDLALKFLFVSMVFFHRTRLGSPNGKPL